MICSSRAVPSVATASDCVSPRVNSAEPWVRGSTLVRMLIGRMVRVSRPSMRGSPDRIWLRTIFDSRSLNAPLAVFTVMVSAPSGSTAAITAFLISLMRLLRSDLLLMRKASLRSCSASSAIFATSASSTGGGVQSHGSLPASSANSLIRLMTACICWWP